MDFYKKNSADYLNKTLVLNNKIVISQIIIEWQMTNDSRVADISQLYKADSSSV